MFNFQKEVVLNSLDKAAVVQAPAAGYPKAEGTKFANKLRFHDGGEYFAKYIVDGKVYRTLPIEGKVFEVEISPKDDMLSHIQILIELGLDNDYRGDYGSALWYFRKPLLIDVDLTGKTPAEATEIINKAFKTVVPKEYKFVEISDYKEGDEKVVIKGADSYQKIRSITLNRYECNERCGDNASEEPIEMDSKDYIKVEQNNVEFGTYEYLLHNLRLPTYANLRFTSPSAPEMPIAGVAYAQYSFAYCVPRGIHFGGLSVAGQTNHSTTLHTFFVPVKKNAEGKYVGNEDFEKLFTEAVDAEKPGLGMSNPFVEIGREGGKVVTILPDAYASSQDLKAASEIADNAKADAELAKKVNENASKNAEQDTAIASKLTKDQADALYASKA